jgi:hypothetical protein
MSEIPKKRQQLFEDLKKYLGAGDDDAVSDLLRNKDPIAIRNELGTALGQHVKQNYDSPLNVFENKKILETVPTEYTKLPDNLNGMYHLDENKIYLPHENPELLNRQMGTKLHELGHADEVLNKGMKSGVPLEEVKHLLKGTGLQNAEEAFSGHHKVGFFEKEALQKLLRNGKLGLGAILPAVGALGIGAAALGMGNKAMAGDFKGAAGDAADLATDFVPGVGEAKMAITPSELGDAEIMPEDQKKFWELKQKLKP